MSDPQQPPADLPYPAPPAAPAAAPAPYGYPAPAPAAARSTGNALGWTALGLGLAVFLLGVVTQLVWFTQPDIVTFSTVSTMLNVLSFVVSLGALIFGILGVRRDANPIIAAIALGVAGSQVLSTIISWASVSLTSFLQ